MKDEHHDLCESCGEEDTYDLVRVQYRYSRPVKVRSTNDEFSGRRIGFVTKASK